MVLSASWTNNSPLNFAVLWMFIKGISSVFLYFPIYLPVAMWNFAVFWKDDLTGSNRCSFCMESSAWASRGWTFSCGFEYISTYMQSFQWWERIFSFQQASETGCKMSRGNNYFFSGAQLANTAPQIQSWEMSSSRLRLFGSLREK